jgi:ankyrin repeat protein
MNQQLEAVRFLLREFEVDVLAQNRFGRSALTEAFATENTDVLQLLLGHSSASEELLQQLPSSKEPLDTTPHGLVITGDEEAQGDENDSTETGEQESVEHCFSFTPETTIAIRELVRSNTIARVSVMSVPAAYRESRQSLWRTSK